MGSLRLFVLGYHERPTTSLGYQGMAFTKGNKILISRSFIC